MVIVPKSTLHNWLNEFRRWCPVIKAVKFHGNGEERVRSHCPRAARTALALFRWLGCWLGADGWRVLAGAPSQAGGDGRSGASKFWWAQRGELL
jgi:hypothetical protein